MVDQNFRKMRYFRLFDELQARYRSSVWYNRWDGNKLQSRTRDSLGMVWESFEAEEVIFRERQALLERKAKLGSTQKQVKRERE